MGMHSGFSLLNIGYKRQSSSVTFSKSVHHYFEVTRHFKTVSRQTVESVRLGRVAVHCYSRFGQHFTLLRA